MAVFSGGQLGFDEGGVLSALSRPFIYREVERFKYDPKGRVSKRTVTRAELAWSDILAGAAVVLGPVVFMWFSTQILTDTNIRSAAETYLKMQLAPVAWTNTNIANAFSGMLGYLRVLPGFI